MEVWLASVQASEDDLSIASLVFGADLVVQLTLYVLVLMSIVCWAIILRKFVQLWRASRQSAAFLEEFWKAKRLDTVFERTSHYSKSPVAAVFKAGYTELAKITAGGGKGLEVSTGGHALLSSKSVLFRNCRRARAPSLPSARVRCGSSAPW